MLMNVATVALYALVASVVVYGIKILYGIIDRAITQKAAAMAYLEFLESMKKLTPGKISDEADSWKPFFSAFFKSVGIVKKSLADLAEEFNKEVLED